MVKTFKQALLGNTALACCLATTLAAARPCAAQRSIDVTPFVGYYPQTHLTSATYWSFLGSGGEFESSQDHALVLGGRVTAWESRRLAFDVSFGHWGSPISGTHRVVHATTGGLGLLLSVGSRDTACFSVVGGLSFVSLSGAVTGQGWGPLLGASARFAIDSVLALRVEMENHLYNSSLGASSSSLRHVLFLSFGLSVRLSRHPEPPT